MSILAIQKHTPSSMLEAVKDNPKIPFHVIEFLKESQISSQRGFDYIIDLYEKTIKGDSFPKVGNPRFEMLETINQGEKVLLEGPQSFYLSNIEGTHPSTTTSAHTHSTGILAAAGLPLRHGVTQIVVTKLPSSRVGSGANPSGYVEQDWFSRRELTKEDLKAIPLKFEYVYQSFISSIGEDGLLDDKIYLDENNEEVKVLNESLKINEAMAIVSCLRFGEFGATTGKPRVCGSLDLPHLKHQVNCDSNYICISCVDRLDGLSKIPIVIGYNYIGEDIYHRGQIFKRGDIINLDNFLPDENVLKYCIPIYEVLDGWQNSRKVEIGDKLDENLENFIEIVENSTKAQVVCFGNGPKSDELVYINKN